MEDDKKLTNKESTNRSNQLTSPYSIKCPICCCDLIIGPSAMLSHYLQEHNDMLCKEIVLDQKSMFLLSASDLKWHENVCLGMLAYSGAVTNEGACPANKDISICNVNLPESKAHLRGHLPVFVMAYRTTWRKALGADDLSNAGDGPQNGELLWLWLGSYSIIKPVYCTLTAFNKLMTSSRSIVHTKVLNLHDYQNPSVLDLENLENLDCLRITHGEINILSQNRTECIGVEIIINEDNE